MADEQMLNLEKKKVVRPASPFIVDTTLEMPSERTMEEARKLR